MSRFVGIALVTGLVVAGLGVRAIEGQQRVVAPAPPVLVFETSKGTFEVEMYPNEAPKSVDHILTLVRRNFYNGLRVHRYAPGFVVQFGDPQTRDMTKRDSWGGGGSGRAIGVGEMSTKRTHKLGAVALASFGGDAKTGDSQLYICINSDPSRYSYMNGKYTVIGQVVSGMNAALELRELDVIRRVSVKAPVPTGPKQP